MTATGPIQRSTRAIVNLSAIGENVAAIRRKIGGERRLMAVVKADGYGHGAVAVARAALLHGADCLGVAIPEEGQALRNAGIDAPILVFGAIQPEEAMKSVAANLEQTVGSISHLDSLDRAGAAAGRIVRVHLKVDTGMGRLGVSPRDAVSMAQEIELRPNLQLVGVFTHFATADDADRSYTLVQLETFKYVLGRFEHAGIDPGIRHAANSAAVLTYPEAHFDMVRPGIIIYGLYPSAEVDQTIAVRPAMHLVTRIAALKVVRSGTPISYGRTYFTQYDGQCIATLPVGYADGYSRRLSNCSAVRVRGQRVPIVGTVCMDMCMADVTSITPIEVGEEVELFGSEPTADEIARCLGTINYEITCNVGKRVPRIYTEEGRP